MLTVASIFPSVVASLLYYGDAKFRKQTPNVWFLTYANAPVYTDSSLSTMVKGTFRTDSGSMAILIQVSLQTDVLAATAAENRYDKGFHCY